MDRVLGMKGGMWLVVNIINEKQKWDPSERIIGEKTRSVKRYESMRWNVGGRAKMKEMDNKGSSRSLNIGESCQ
jgi:hypothetical protein